MQLKRQRPQRVAKNKILEEINMAETKKEYEDTRDATDTGDLFFGGRAPTINVDATEDKAAFVKSPNTQSTGGNASSTSA